MSRSAAPGRLRALMITAALAAFWPLLGADAAMARLRPHYGGEVRVETAAAEAPDFVKLLVTETLTSVDMRGEVQPGLALRWEAQNGGRRWQFWLRPGLRLHGSQMDAPLTSVVVAEAIRTGLAGLAMEARIHTAGDWVSVEFDAPMPQFAALLAAAPFAVGAQDIRGVVVGSGPYAIESIAAPRITLVANPDYRGGRRFPETITVLCSRSAHEQALDLADNRADLVEVAPEELRRAQQERIRLSLAQPSELIVLAAGHARSSDLRLRQALSESIDRAALLNFIFQKQGETSAGLLPDWITGYGALLSAPQNPAHARQLRAEVGGRPGFSIGYEPDDAQMQLLAERIALNARETGLTVQAVARTANVDWVLRRILVQTANPAAALTAVLGALHEPLELGDATLESVFRAERGALANYTAIPLLHLDRAWAASERLHDWSNASPFSPLTAESWVEARP